MAFGKHNVGIRSAFLALWALTCVVSCAPHDEPPVPTKIEIHDGLQFSIPENRKVKVTGEALSIIPIASHSRRLMTIRIWIDHPEPFFGDFMEKREKPALHSYGEASGGMGGPEYYISIPKRVGGRDIMVNGLVQLEYGRPNFSDVWAVWESLEVAPEGGVEKAD